MKHETFYGIFTLNYETHTEINMKFKNLNYYNYRDFFPYFIESITVLNDKYDVTFDDNFHLNNLDSANFFDSCEVEKGTLPLFYSGWIDRSAKFQTEDEAIIAAKNIKEKAYREDLFGEEDALYVAKMTLDEVIIGLQNNIIKKRDTIIISDVKKVKFKPSKQEQKKKQIENDISTSIRNIQDYIKTLDNDEKEKVLSQLNLIQSKKNKS